MAVEVEGRAVVDHRLEGQGNVAQAAGIVEVAAEVESGGGVAAGAVVRQRQGRVERAARNALRSQADVEQGRAAVGPVQDRVVVGRRRPVHAVEVVDLVILPGIVHHDQGLRRVGDPGGGRRPVGRAAVVLPWVDQLQGGAEPVGRSRPRRVDAIADFIDEQILGRGGAGLNQC